ncbi:protein ALKAL-like [Electrophorus electricus]|uniref:protein ALKAL-like n=1 Tax=Electrophorus electricus TaxID=8005 RepID=UPI000F09C6FB|nr:protein ALKAL-like [Electrophorus electricus]
MHAEKRWQMWLSVIILLITSSQCMDSYDGKRKEKRTLLDLVLYGRELESRRVTSGLYFVSHDVKFSAREKTAVFPKRDTTRPIEIIPRDVSIKDKFIKHFTAGPVKFSSECRLHFHRIYHNTRECGRPAYYKRCARLLTRLAMSPLCAQP